MNGFKLTKLFRKATILGMTVSSIFGVPLPKVKTKDEDSDEDLRLVKEDGIISSEDMVEGQWTAFSYLDEHLYRYESLENLVSYDNELDGRFWKSVKISGEQPDLYRITGTRSDDIEFSVSHNFDIRDRHRFDQLCQEFNKKLTVEIV